MILLSALLVVMSTVLAPPRTPFLSDEGAYILEARLVASTGRWTTKEVLEPPSANRFEYPTGAFYSNHPAYPLVLAAAQKIFGNRGYVLLSLVGTALAAFLSAAVARRIAPSLAVPTLWLVGVGSPLFFDSFIAVAHTLAAAAAGGGLNAVLALGQNARSLRASIGWAACLALSVGVGAFLRSEGILVAGALMAGTIVMAWTERQLLRRWLAICGAIGAATVGVHFFEGKWIRDAVGVSGEFPSFSYRSRHTFLMSKITAVAHNLLSPLPFTPKLGSYVLVVGAIGALMMGIAARREEGKRATILGGVLLCGCYGLWFMGGGSSPVSGLFIAWPVAIVGAACLRWRDAWREPGLRIALVTTFTFMVSVIFVGGDAVYQWGGRYFSAMVPLVAPVVIVGIRHAAPILRRSVQSASVVVVMMLMLLAVKCINAQHLLNSNAVNGIANCARYSGPRSAGGDNRQIVVVSDETVPDVSWSTYSNYTWLNTNGISAGVLLRQLAAEGVSNMVLAYRGHLDPSDFQGYRVVAACRAGLVGTAFALQLDGPPAPFSPG